MSKFGTLTERAVTVIPVAALSILFVIKKILWTNSEVLQNIKFYNNFRTSKFGGLALICCGVASKVFSNFIDFSKKESNTLKVFSLLHYFIGGAALMEGSVGLAWMTFKQRPLFNHVNDCWLIAKLF